MSTTEMPGVSRHRLVLTAGRAREVAVLVLFACTTDFSSTGTVKCLFVLVEEEVVGRIRHESLLTHIAGDSATGSGSRSAFGV